MTTLIDIAVTVGMIAGLAYGIVGFAFQSQRTPGDLSVIVVFAFLAVYLPAQQHATLPPTVDLVSTVVMYVLGGAMIALTHWYGITAGGGTDTDNRKDDATGPEEG